ncbi:MAG: TIGR01212 family radical SAM protein [Bacteroidales bacterium]|nr:TIGR01212 family radical SAM protein [Bacteroidales bacterium]MCF8456023.1 TIGR01212 family radical SAM protein [Bacteroidales bacterium]
MKYPWKHTRRFNTYSHHLKEEFGGRVQKLSLDAGFTCPNRDGSKGKGGCTFCNNQAFNPSYCLPSKSIRQQLDEGIEFHRIRYRRSYQYLAYFQAYSNTYAPIEDLKAIYEQAINHPEIIGIVVGTRPDCVNDALLDYFQHLSKEIYLSVEYGIESCYEKTLIRINRGHSFDDSKKAIIETAGRGIKTGAHMIIGMPGESREEIIAQAGILSKLPLHSLKFHQLQLIKATTMAREYVADPTQFTFFQIDEYIEIMIDFLEKLSPDIQIQRFAGEAPPPVNLTPVKWGLRYDVFLNKLERRLEERDTWQGRLYQSRVGT